VASWGLVPQASRLYLSIAFVVAFGFLAGFGLLAADFPLSSPELFRVF
jgi:hypothetical protein